MLSTDTLRKMRQAATGTVAATAAGLTLAASAGAQAADTEHGTPQPTESGFVASTPDLTKPQEAEPELLGSKPAKEPADPQRVTVAPTPLDYDDCPACGLG